MPAIQRFQSVTQSHAHLSVSVSDGDNGGGPGQRFDPAPVIATRAKLGGDGGGHPA